VRARLDNYGRTLADLYLEPGDLFVNRAIVAKGFRHAYVKDPFRFMDDFRTVQHQAREKKPGLWGRTPRRAGRSPGRPAKAIRPDLDASGIPYETAASKRRFAANPYY
jgi:endonuclease YncB( thermonuclease family)